MGRDGFRTASVRARSPGPEGGGAALGASLLAASLLAASPRVAVAGPGLCRADARGWGLRGGERALARALRRAAEEGGFGAVRVGIADTAVASDAAAALAVSSPVIVPPGEDPAFLAPLPLDFLPLSGELIETFRALGIRRIGEVAELERSELEARFGPEGVRAHRLARGEDDRVFRALHAPELPEARVELDGPVGELEPLLFVLRHLLARLCGELGEEGRCAARLELELRSEGRPGAARTAGKRAPPATAPEAARIPIVPARPTAREDALFDLCRAVLERELAGSVGVGPVSALALRAGETAPAEARQGDLFAPGWRDPLATAAALARLRARVGEEGVVRPVPRPDHRPEVRSRWTPVESAGDAPAGGRGAGGARVEAAVGARAGPGIDVDRVDREDREPAPLSPALRLLPRPVPLKVRAEGGRPAALGDGEGRRRVSAAEGPERLSGDWWREAPYGREYWRLATEDGELLWVFREGRPGRARWWLHGWWD